MSGGTGLILGIVGALALAPSWASAQTATAHFPMTPNTDQALSDVLFAQRAAVAATLGQAGLGPTVFGPSAGAAGPVVGNPSGYSLAPGGGYSHAWPSVQLAEAGRYSVNLYPQTALSSTSFGRNAQAGAMVRVSSVDSAIAERLSAMGVKSGAALDQSGRWFLFAAVNGRAVGFNMLQNSSGGLQRGGWTTDQSSALVGDGQVGVGWRKGAVEASVGYVHREVKFQTADYNGSSGWSDSMAAVSFTFRPH